MAHSNETHGDLIRPFLIKLLQFLVCNLRYKCPNWMDSERLTESVNLLWNLNLTIGLYLSVRSSRYEARGKFGEHEGCVRVARGVAKSNSSFLSIISQWMHGWRMNQLFYNIFRPMENFFSRWICLLTSWVCTMGIWSSFAQLNLIRQIY